ncbi:MAG: Rieske (2Fe-2S) protein [Sphingobacteriales bacterium]|nr:Rieske (2Fe-2S) protein [Sphingobacteriales bacterium]
MDRKDFLSQVGVGAAAFLAPICLGGIAGCGKSSSGSTSSVPSPPSNVDFTLDVSSGALASNGGFLVSQGILVARTSAGAFLAVSAACTHEGTTVNYNAANNNFVCPNHGAKFSNTGMVTLGPATTNLKSYNTSLTNSTLRIYS